jgi:ketosteroid isomerase-like protein
VAQSLLDADRGFATSAASVDMLTALANMFAEGVVMPAPPTGLLIGKSAVLAAIGAQADVAKSHITWTPHRVGVSADGTHGFSFGFMTQTKADGTRAALKYMAYWIREGASWRVVAYKRGRAPGPPADTTVVAPALPAALVAMPRDTGALSTLRHGLMDAEASFSATAQRVGLGNAFAAFGSADAVNMGGPTSATYVTGAAAIAALVGGSDMTASPVHWSADTAFVAPSGDLGITFGKILPNQVPAGAAPPPGSPFFTIWRRADIRGPWRYVAE